MTKCPICKGKMIAFSSSLKDNLVLFCNGCDVMLSGKENSVNNAALAWKEPAEIAGAESEASAKVVTDKSGDMIMDKVKKVAMAIRESIAKDDMIYIDNVDLEATIIDGMVDLLAVARAAIEEMQDDPTPEKVK